jgi:hypothetical protein
MASSSGPRIGFPRFCPRSFARQWRLHRWTGPVILAVLALTTLAEAGIVLRDWSFILASPSIAVPFLLLATVSIVLSALLAWHLSRPTAREVEFAPEGIHALRSSLLGSRTLLFRWSGLRGRPRGPSDRPQRILLLHLLPPRLLELDLEPQLAQALPS